MKDVKRFGYKLSEKGYLGFSNILSGDLCCIVVTNTFVTLLSVISATRPQINVCYGIVVRSVRREKPSDV